MTKRINQVSAMNIIINGLLDRVLFLGVFVLFVIPFLIPYSYMPVSKFYSEMFSLIFASFIGLIGVYRANKIHISTVGIASLIFGIFLLLQILFVNIRFPGINIVAAIEFFIATLLSIGITSFIGGART